MIPLLGTILSARTGLDKAAIDIAATEARAASQRLGESLIASGAASEDQVHQCLAEQFSLPYLATIDAAAVERAVRELPLDLYKEGRCLPLGCDDRCVRVVMADPLDLDTPAAIAAVSGLAVEVSLSSPARIDEVRRQVYEEGSTLQHLAGSLTKQYEKEVRLDATDLTLDEIRKKTESQPVVRLVSLLFDEAIKLRASDIHVEPGEHEAVVRFRIDGMLVRHTDMSRAMYVPVISRIKILADLDIAEKRVPQDGRIHFVYQARDFDFRVSTLPTHHGEKIVIRILKHDEGLLDMANLGMPQREMAQLLELIEKPQGMVFVTGPTGSGKSATLFACLNRIRRKAINITTIENPIEQKLDGINQVQINEKAGVTFAATLRSILRQDPDVILVGEIRDKETAEIAIQASQTGHLVFATLHTNDAVSAITRLRDLDIPGFMIGSSILGVLAQRLVRLLCPHCKVKEPPPAEVQGRWRTMMGDIPLPSSYRPVGCDKCGKLGYRGRSGVFEMVMVDEDIRTMITANAPEGEIRRACRAGGMKALIENGVAKVAEGLTTPEELLRVVIVQDLSWQ